MSIPAKSAIVAEVEVEANADPGRLNALAYRVVGAAFRVGSELGPGFLEKVYENALAIELAELGIAVEQQHTIPVRYKGRVVGNYLADLLVEQSLVVEVKAVNALDQAHFSQCVHYLRATGLKLGLRVNFGRRSVQHRRIVNRL